MGVCEQGAPERGQQQLSGAGESEAFRGGAELVGFPSQDDPGLRVREQVKVRTLRRYLHRVKKSKPAPPECGAGLFLW